MAAPDVDRIPRGLAVGVPLGRIAGVEVRLHWTWWIAAALIAAGLAGSVFPDAVPGLSSGSYLAMGLVTAVLFFASLLLHELGHALAALALDADTALLSAVPALAEDALHRAAVLRAGRLVGLLTLRDVSRAVRLRTEAAAGLRG